MSDFAILGEVGPVVGDSAVDFELAALGQSPGKDGADGLADRVAADDRVLGPGFRVFGVGPAAVDVDDEFAVEGDGEGGAGLGAVDEVLLELLPDGGEAGIAVALHRRVGWGRELLLGVWSSGDDADGSGLLGDVVEDGDLGIGQHLAGGVGDSDFLARIDFEHGDAVGVEARRQLGDQSEDQLGSACTGGEGDAGLVFGDFRFELGQPVFGNVGQVGDGRSGTVRATASAGRPG